MYITILAILIWLTWAVTKAEGWAMLFVVCAVIVLFFAFCAFDEWATMKIKAWAKKQLDQA